MFCRLYLSFPDLGGTVVLSSKPCSALIQPLLCTQGRWKTFRDCAHLMEGLKLLVERRSPISIPASNASTHGSLKLQKSEQGPPQACEASMAWHTTLTIPIVSMDTQVRIYQERYCPSATQAKVKTPH